MNKNILYIIMLAILPMVMAISPAPNGECYVHEPVLLASGANGIGIIPDYDTLSLGTFTIDLVNGSGPAGPFNLLSFSAQGCIDLVDLQFYNFAGDKKNYTDAKDSGWINALEFIENLETTGVVEEFTKICNQEAYWIESFLATNISYENVVGSPIDEIFDWSDLRFSNGTDEESVSDVDVFGLNWVDTNLRFWRDNAFKVASDVGVTTDLDSWRGYFVISNLDNIYLITNNATRKCKVKIKCSGKFIGNDKVCKQKIRAKYVGANKIFKPKYFLNHAVRFFGAKRKTIG